MRTVFGTAFRLLTAASALCGAALLQPATADTTFYQNNSQFGMNLPQAALPTGQEEIRTSDGTTCRSAVGGDGTYMDVGVIGTPGGDDINSSAAAYGRVVIPLGYKPKRVDCTKLYDLEIERLKMELALARMGMSGGAPSSASAANNWANEGWSTESSGVAAPAQTSVVAKPVSAQPSQASTKVNKKKKSKVVEAAPIEAVIVIESIY